MAQAAAEIPPRPWTVDDFLDWERQQEERYEFVGGIIRMMVGGTADHNTIAGNIFATLRGLLRGKPCRPFMEGMKVRSATASMYPDVVVTCTDVPPKNDVVPEPVIVFEVLSRSTQDHDRGQKWSAYQSIPSLRQYVLISQDELEVDVYLREGDGWRYNVRRGAGVIIDLAVAEIRLSMAEIYEGSSLDPARAAG
jgi:Uma2 family endonuclease